jgi:hypothetical protein
MLHFIKPSTHAHTLVAIPHFNGVTTHTHTLVYVGFSQQTKPLLVDYERLYYLCPLLLASFLLSKSFENI